MSRHSDLVWAYNLIGMVSCGVIIVFQLLFIFLLIFKLHRQTEPVEVVKSIKYSTFSCLINTTISYLMLMMSRIRYIQSPQTNQWLIYWVLYYVFIGMTMVSIYLFSIARLYETFDGTVYKPARKVIYTHLICALIAFISIASSPIIGQVESIDGLFFINVGVAAIIILCGLAHLTYLFNRCLFIQVITERLETRKHSRMRLPATKFDSNRLRSSSDMLQNGASSPSSPPPPTVSRQCSEASNMSSPSSANRHDKQFSVELHHIQIKILQTVRKHALLGSSILLSVIAAALTPWLYIFCGDSECRGMFYCVWYPFHAANMVMASLCLYLGFAINHDQYTVICFFCDKKCASLCHKMAIQSIENNPADTPHSNL